MTVGIKCNENVLIFLRKSFSDERCGNFLSLGPKLYEEKKIRNSKKLEKYLKSFFW